MAELSNHSYHYKANSLTVPRRAQVAQFTERQSSDEESENYKGKKQRRRKRMLTGVSKQRRAANERERRRLNIINQAFKQLKSILPLYHGEENISKIEVVRLATKTIRYLSDILKETSSGQQKVTRSPIGSEFTDEPFSSASSLSDTNDSHLEVFDFNEVDISTLLCPSSIEPNIFPPTSNGFDGLDISTVINQSDDENDVFPSMLYL